MLRAGLLCRWLSSRAEILGLERVAVPSGSILEQYKMFVQQHPDHLVMMQVGDFYEFYGEAAEKVSSLLDIALGRAGSGPNKVPFTGFPVRSLSVHLGRLVRKDMSVVVCEQYQEKNRSSFKRRVAQIVTPGTVTDPDMLESRSHNYLLSMVSGPDSCALAWTDVSTGQVYVRTVPTAQALAEVKRIHPKEIIADSPIHGLDVRVVEQASTDDLVTEFYPDAHELTFDLASEHEAGVFRQLLQYIKSTQVHGVPRLSLPRRTTEQMFMSLPGNVMQALGLTDINGREGLMAGFCYAKTGPGTRLFTERLSFPSMSISEINHRLDAVQLFVDDGEKRAAVRSALDGLSDFARAFQRLRSERSGVSPKDLRCVVSAVRAGQKLQSYTHFVVHPDLAHFADTCESAIDDSTTRVFKAGFDADLDALYDSLNNETEIKALEQRMRTDTGNPDLSVVCVRGEWLVETPRSNPLCNAPPSYHLDSSTSLKLRYRHKDLLVLLYAKEQQQQSIDRLEQSLLCRLVQSINASAMDRLVVHLAETDVASANAELAYVNHYCRPVMFADTRYAVTHGRHPLLEQVRRSTFVRNSLHLAHFALITGPNMGGKSTFLRQAALISIMAQAGLFVPAAKADLGLVDAVFTRVGSSDDIAANQSTFMMEMREAGEILRTATPRSLVLMDEVGRGTGWEEGFALAYAIVKYLIDHVKARCLFATHYADLARAVEERCQSCLKTDAVVNPDGSLTPLYSVTKGVAEHSFAVAVARAAGLPPVVLDEAVRKWREIKDCA